MEPACLTRSAPHKLLPEPIACKCGMCVSLLLHPRLFLANCASSRNQRRSFWHFAPQLLQCRIDPGAVVLAGEDVRHLAGLRLVLGLCRRVDLLDIVERD